MALQKQTLNVNFSQGLDTKSDPFQVPVGKFLDLENSVFTKGGMLQKRNGFAPITSLPDSSSTYLTTFNGNLTAVGTNLFALVNGSSQWINKGAIQPVEINTLSLIRSNTNQSYADSAISTNNLVCTVFTDNVPSGGSNVQIFKYVIADSITGQNISPPQEIPLPSGTIVDSPKVIFLGNNFLILLSILDTGVYYLKYLRISLATPTLISAPVVISDHYFPATSSAFDATVIGSSLYVAWNGNATSIHVTAILSNLQQINTIVIAGNSATVISI